jgi:putative aldouronate transport system substrate-binding protein
LKTKTKLMGLLVAILILIASVTGYASQKKPSLVEITQLAWDRGTIPSAEGTIQDNWWTRYVNQQMKKVGVKVKFVPIPRAQEALKLPTLLAAGEAPDLCMTYDKVLLDLYIKNGAVNDLTSLYSKYGKNLKKIYSAKDLAVGKYQGKLYSLPVLGRNPAPSTWFRKDWLDKLGLKEPTNIEEFYKTIKAIKEKDPGKVGDRLIPFAIPAEANDPMLLIDSNILPAFVKRPPTGERLVTPYQLWPETKEAFRFLNKLYNEKLLGEFILDKDGSQFKQKVIRGEVGSFLYYGHWPYHSAYGNVLANLQNNIPEAKLAASYPFKAANAKTNFIDFFRDSKYGMRLFCPKTCKHPDAVMKYLDWWATDAAMVGCRFGIEGTDYKLIDDIPAPINREKYSAHVSWIQPQYNAIAQMYINDGPKWLKLASQQFEKKYQPEYIKNAVWSGYLKYAMPELTLPTPVSDKYKAVLDRKWNEAKVKIILGSPSEFDKSYDAALKEYKAGGGEDIAKEAVSVYKQIYKK